MFSVKLLIGFWILDVFVAAQTPNSIFMSNTHEFFPDIIRKGKSALFNFYLYIYNQMLLLVFVAWINSYCTNI